MIETFEEEGERFLPSAGFLVMTLKAGHSLRVGPDVEFVITKIQNGQARVCIKAPKSFKIDRERKNTMIIGQ